MRFTDQFTRVFAGFCSTPSLMPSIKDFMAIGSSYPSSSTQHAVPGCYESCCGRDGASRSCGNQKWVSNSQRSLGIRRKRLHRRGSVSAFDLVLFAFCFPAFCFPSFCFDWVFQLSAFQRLARPVSFSAFQLLLSTLNSQTIN